MAKEKQLETPELDAQDKSAEETKEKLLAGKFKSPEDLENAYQELERHKAEMAEQLAQSKRMLSLLEVDGGTAKSDFVPVQQPAPAAPADNTFKYDGDDEELKPIYQALDHWSKDLEQKLLGKTQAQIAAIEGQRQAKEKFYRENADLADYGDLVDYEAEKVVQMVGYPKTDAAKDKLSKEVASRVRERINKIRGTAEGGKELLHVESGRSTSPTPKIATPEEKEVSEEEALAQYVRERQGRQMKQKTPK